MHWHSVEAESLCKYKERKVIAVNNINIKARFGISNELFTHVWV